MRALGRRGIPRRVWRTREPLGFLQDARAAQAAVDQARLRYEQGYIEYFEVLDAEQQLTGVRSDLVQSRIETATAMVSVYRSLAGAPPQAEQLALGE